MENEARILCSNSNRNGGKASACLRQHLMFKLILVKSFASGFNGGDVLKNDEF